MADADPPRKKSFCKRRAKRCILALLLAGFGNDLSEVIKCAELLYVHKNNAIISMHTKIVSTHVLPRHFGLCYQNLISLICQNQISASVQLNYQVSFQVAVISAKLQDDYTIKVELTDSCAYHIAYFCSEPI